jgi:exonuclease SbcD
MGADAGDHASAYAERVRRLLDALCQRFRPDTVNLVAAHLFATGGTLGGGERQAQTILDYAVPSTAFAAGAHYVALGHLHRSQKIAGGCPIWYAGSPLQLDFGEVKDEKSTLVIEAAVGRPAQVRQVPIGAGRRLRTVSGTLEELAAIEVSDEYLKVLVREPARAGLADDVRALLPQAVDVVVMAPDRDERDRARRGRQRFPEAQSPQELFAAYLAEQQIDDPRVTALFGELLEDAGAS